MTLIKNKYDYKEIKKASVEGRRLYACPDGNSVASVTTILDATKDKTHLIAWRKRVGETKAKEITKSAPKNENTEKNVLVKFFTSVIAPIIGIPIRITKFMMVRPAVKYFAEVISSIFPAQ